VLICTFPYSIVRHIFHQRLVIYAAKDCEINVDNDIILYTIYLRENQKRSS